MLANLAKSPSLKRLLTLERALSSPLPSSHNAADQLLDLFVRGLDPGPTSDEQQQDGDRSDRLAPYDHLAYLFADLSRHDEARQHLTTAQAYDGVVPIGKLAVFTQHPSPIRRRGVAGTLKNACFPPTDPIRLLGPDGAEILPYLLRPLVDGADAYTPDESLELPEDLQLLDAGKRREPDGEILVMHLETVLLLTHTRESREYLREHGVYYVIRELHAAVDDEAVQEICDRIVQMLMRDEPAEDDERTQSSSESSDEDEKVVDIF